jgi:hypothetical protein
VVDVEARARLESVLSVCGHEMKALDSLEDARLAGVLQVLATLRAEIVAALATIKQPPTNGDAAP